ncbi:ROK family protein [Arthrobacter pityocampae]|uniref:ROK family protein n=1 Tax=Arthrobacter pityocampae TaxID=547334 RepID=UPI00373604A9
MISKEVLPSLEKISPVGHDQGMSVTGSTLEEHEPAPRPEHRTPASEEPSLKHELVREVLVHGPITRGALARRLGLSAASLTRLSKPLLEDGFLIETAEPGAAGVGRPVRPLDVRVDAQWHIGVKLTGQQAFGVATDLRASVLAEDVIDFEGSSLQDVVEAVNELVERLTHGVGAKQPSALGVSVGGQVRGSHMVARAPFLGWRNVDLGGALERELGLPVVVANDVVALTEAEHWFGLGRGLDDFAVITTGAGVGYGLVLRGRQMITADTGLGLGGHFPLDADGPVCIDGHKGCSTAMLSIPSICRLVADGLGRDVSYEDVLALAGAGDPVALAVIRTAGHALGKMIAAVANLTMVTTVILAGEGIGLVSTAQATIEEALRNDRDPEASAVRILVGDSDFGVWARGAAAVAIQTLVGRIS